MHYIFKYAEHWPAFYTATILNWKRLLKPDKYKQVIVDSLKFLVNEGRIKVYGFVIMESHIHIIWHTMNGYTPDKIQLSFMKYTAQQIKFDLEANHPKVLEKFKVEAKDRLYQIWERNSLSTELFSPEVFIQKLNYIHENPVKAGICYTAEEYHYSSARFYASGIDEFGFLSKYFV